jgi:hypothetical protein
MYGGTITGGEVTDRGGNVAISGGVFNLYGGLVENGKAEEFASFVKAYVENLQKTYRAMDYFPEEVEKIDCATYKVFGNYVVYSFLNENDTNAFYDAFKALIEK